MVKIGLSIICLLEAIMVMFCASSAVKRKEYIAKNISDLLYASCISLVVTAMHLICKNFLLMSFFYNCFFASITWVTFCLFRLGLRYAEIDDSHKWVNGLFVFINIIDSGAIILNIVTGELLRYEIQYDGGDLYFQVYQLPLFRIHLIICYFYMAMFLLLLVIKMAFTSVAYWANYINIFFMLVVVILIDGIFLTRDLYMNYSVLFYGIIGIHIYYVTFYFMKGAQVKNITQGILDHIRASIILFDEHDRCIRMNQDALEIFGDSGTGIKVGELCRKWGIASEDELSEDFSKEIILRVFSKKKMYLSVVYHKAYDDKNHYLGSYLQLYDITNWVFLNKKEQYMATHDESTGLYNRNYFYEMGRELLNRYPEMNYKIVCVNVRNFKMLNETFGRNFGDHVILHIARWIKELKKNDKIVSARLVADRFISLVPCEMFPIEEFEKHEQFTMKYKGIRCNVRLCFSVYTIEDRSIPIEVMCDRAIMGLDFIKHEYQKAVFFYDETIRKKELRNHRLVDQLEGAIERKEFAIYLQPQIDYEQAKVISSEALVRWIHPKEGLISPGEFVPLFEENGLITKLDMYVWETVCQTIHRWQEKGAEYSPISVNISMKDFYSIDLCETFKRLVSQYQIKPESLNLEITESAFVIDFERNIKVIERLKDMGFQVEMDDFGSGYSSLNTIKNIPVNVLKLDLKFLEKGDDPVRNDNIMDLIINLAHRLKMEVIAEGVEEAEQASFLHEMGCNIMQGYYYAKPMSIVEFEKHIMEVRKGMITPFTA